MKNSQKIAKDWLEGSKYTRLKKKLAIQYALVKAHCIGKFKMGRKVQN
jgi:hypothetical protein